MQAVICLLVLLLSLGVGLWFFSGGSPSDKTRVIVHYGDRDALGHIVEEELSRDRFIEDGLIEFLEKEDYVWRVRMGREISLRRIEGYNEERFLFFYGENDSYFLVCHIKRNGDSWVLQSVTPGKH